MLALLFLSAVSALPYASYLSRHLAFYVLPSILCLLTQLPLLGQLPLPFTHSRCLYSPMAAWQLITAKTACEPIGIWN